VPLSSLEALEWHADDTGLVLRNFDANKHKSRLAKKEFYNTDARLKFIDTAEQVVGECEQEEKSASIWYVGISQLFFSAIALLYCGGISIAAYLDPARWIPLACGAEAVGLSVTLSMPWGQAECYLLAWPSPL